MDFNTTLLHHNFESERSTGSTLTPIYQVSAFSQESAEKLEAVFNNRAPGFAYTRIGNPTTDSFERRIASLEKGIGAIACSSGMAAVTMSLLNILQSGDEVIASTALFGGTIDLFHDLEAFGIKTRYVTEVTAESVRSQLSDKTKAVFTELIGNPKLNVVDIQSVADVAHEAGVPLIVDSTTATPYLVHPFDFGADIVVHSSSKYINGNGSAISGIIVDSGKFKWDYTKYDKADKINTSGAHPNSRFTAKAENCPCLSDEFYKGAGVPVEAIIFGGRRAKTAPLVYQSTSWQNGTFVGSIMASETTAAAAGAIGVVRRDPMAMRPFVGYNMGDYWAHWLKMGNLIPNPPKIFHVNWFRTDAEGHFIWPGFGDNMRVLMWILGRCEGKYDADLSPIGYLPKAEDINIEGLNGITRDTIRELLTIDKQSWLDDVAHIREFYAFVGQAVPHALYDELDALEARLKN